MIREVGGWMTLDYAEMTDKRDPHQGPNLPASEVDCDRPRSVVKSPRVSAELCKSMRQALISRKLCVSSLRRECVIHQCILLSAGR